MPPTWYLMCIQTLATYQQDAHTATRRNIVSLVACPVMEHQSHSMVISWLHLQFWKLWQHSCRVRTPTAAYINMYWQHNGCCIFNSAIKRQRSQSTEMRYFWLLDQALQKYFKYYYQPGAELLTDYTTKAHHTGPMHTQVHPYYSHMQNLSTQLYSWLRKCCGRRLMTRSRR